MSINMIRVDSNNHLICVDSSNHWVRVDSNKICRIGHPCNESREKETVGQHFHTGAPTSVSPKTPQTTVDCPEILGDLLPPSPPAEKATASQDQAGESGTDKGP
jgi:hypothetical protein